MDNQHEQMNTLTEIRSMMERSSRFISLSGISGVSAGIFALTGALAVYLYLGIGLFSDNYFHYVIENGLIDYGTIRFFIVDALLVLVLSFISGIYFTTRNARKKGLTIWNKSSQLTLINLLIPLTAGGIFCLILLYHYIIYLIAPAMLIFYGLSLINASKYTFKEVRYLGFAELGVGLAASMFVGYGLLAWSLGFGVLHIIYGLLMYFRYEK